MTCVPIVVGGIEPQHRNGFETGLVREMCEGHSFFGKSHVALARRIDCDEVLFEVDGGPAVAVVHPGYAVESEPQWPATGMFTSLAEFEQQCMRADITEYGDD